MRESAQYGSVGGGAGRTRCVPALGLAAFTGLYDSVLALTMRERRWRPRPCEKIAAHLPRGGRVGDVGAEAQHMAALVEDLLLLARLDQGRPLHDEPVDLAQIVKETVDTARAADPRRSIVLELRGGDAMIRGDRLRLRQVLDNLLANIRDHTHPDTTATVTLAGGNGVATLTVADDGPGMSRDEAAHAFERFWQAEPTPTHPRRGTGLGLAIVAELVAAHGGTITLKTSSGSGTHFTITLPTDGATRDGDSAPRSDC